MFYKFCILFKDIFTNNSLSKKVWKKVFDSFSCVLDQSVDWQYNTVPQKYAAFGFKNNVRFHGFA